MGGGETAAAHFPGCGCGQVRAGSGPLHVQGTSAPGPAGPLHGALTGTSCVSYRNQSAGACQPLIRPAYAGHRLRAISGDQA